MEYLDIVNENDEVIGRNTRKYVHDNYLIHRDIHILIENSKGNVLLQKRSLKKKDRPGQWDSTVGEHVLSGENYDAAAIRGAKEEVGVDIPLLALEKVCDYKSYNKRQKTNRRLFILYLEGPFNDFDREEVECLEWWDFKKIETEIQKGDLLFIKGFKLSFEKYMKYKKLI